MTTRSGKPRDVQPSDAVTAPVAQTTPSSIGYGPGDHSFTLQAIMELSKSVGEIKTTLDGFKSSIDGMRGKVDDLVSWKNRILGGTVVLGLLFSVAAFLVGKFSDYITIRAPAAPETHHATPAAPSTTPPVTTRIEQPPIAATPASQDPKGAKP